MLAALRSFRPRTFPPAGLKPSAVLVPLRPCLGDAEALELILTRRADTLGSHAGQVSFPGGRIDTGDAGPEATALREMHEELGVPPHKVELLGRLDDMPTVTGYHVAPVAGLLPADVVMQPSPLEVARVFSVPLEYLLDEASWTSQQHVWGKHTMDVWHLPFDGEDVWGATAHILRGLVELLRSGPTS